MTNDDVTPMKRYLFLALVLMVALTGCKEKSGEEPKAEKMPAKGLAIDVDHFPDAVFRNALKDREEGADGILTDEEIDNLVILDLSHTGLGDLHGIELLHNVSCLYLNGNMLTGMDLSFNKKLTEVDCTGCERMKKITLGHQPLLEYINFSDTDVSEIDVTGCPRLTKLSCTNAPVAIIDLSQCTRLQEICCDALLIPALDTSACPTVKFVDDSGHEIGI